MVKAYQPTTEQLKSIALAKKRQSSDKELKQDVINFQQNIYKDVMNSNKLEAIKLSNVLNNYMASTLNISKKKH